MKQARYVLLTLVLFALTAGNNFLTAQARDSITVVIDREEGQEELKVKMNDSTILELGDRRIIITRDPDRRDADRRAADAREAERREIIIREEERRAAELREAERREIEREARRVEDIAREAEEELAARRASERRGTYEYRTREREREREYEYEYESGRRNRDEERRSSGEVIILRDEDGDGYYEDENEGRDERHVYRDHDEEGNERVVIRIEEDDDDDHDRRVEYVYEEKDDHRERNRPNRTDVDFLGFDIGTTNYYFEDNYGSEALPAGYENLAVRTFRPGSHVALHLFPTRVGIIGRNFISLKTALTVDWTQYYFEQNVTLADDQPELTVIQLGEDVRRSKLEARYFQVPLLLQLNTAPRSDDGLKISFGGYAGVLWGSKTKYVLENEDEFKQQGDFNLNDFRYGLMARFDLKWLDIYAMYHMSELFRENEGPAIQSFSVGVNIFEF